MLANMMNMRRLCVCVAALSMQAVSAETYYWYGTDSDSPLDPSKYHVSASASSESLSEQPAPGSDVYVAGNSVIYFNDDTASYLASLARIQTTGSSCCTIDISTNVTVSTTFIHSTAPGVGNVVKRGAGTLSMTGTGLNDYYTSFDVQEGDLVFPQTGQEDGKMYRHAALSVAEGCTIYLDGGASANGFTIRCTKGIHGKGDITYTNESAACTLDVAGSETECFSGILSGSKLKLDVNGVLMLDNAANTFAHADGNMRFLIGTLGFRKLGNNSDSVSSVGCLTNGVISLNNSDSVRTFLCLATAADGAQSSGREIRNYGSNAVAFDGGAYGGFTYEGKMKVYHSRMNEIVLTGSNTETCVWYGLINTGGSYTGYEYLTKRGTGTWRMHGVPNNASGSTRMTALAGIGVENGTLEFEQVYGAGSMCSLGAAPADYLFGYALKDTIANVAASNKVTYAIRLGNVSDLSEEGTFEYVGTTAGICTTRPIAVTGRGRIKNSAFKTTTNYELRWEDIRSVVPPEDASLVPELSTLTFDGSKDAGWATNITEEAGAAPLRIAKEGSGTWTLGGTLGFTGGIDVRAGTLNIGAAVSASQPHLRCDGGATLDASGGSVTATGIVIDLAKGVGTISGVEFAAAEGTVSVLNPGETDFAEGVEIVCDMSGCTGLSNVAGYRVEVDGVYNRRLVAKATATGFRIGNRAPGLAIIFR